MLWDRGEANGYAQHMTDDPYPGTPTHQVLMIEAFGDHQVANIGTETEARTIGAVVRTPALAPGRSPTSSPFWGIEAGAVVAVQGLGARDVGLRDARAAALEPAAATRRSTATTRTARPATLRSSATRSRGSSRTAEALWTSAAPVPAGRSPRGRVRGGVHDRVESRRAPVVARGAARGVGREGPHAEDGLHTGAVRSRVDGRRPQRLRHAQRHPEP